MSYIDSRGLNVDGHNDHQYQSSVAPKLTHSASFENTDAPKQEAAATTSNQLITNGVRFDFTGRIDYTVFADEFARELRHCWGSDLAALAEVIRSPIAASKGELPLLKLAWYGDLRTDRGCLRHDANILWIDGCELDVDDAKGLTLHGAAGKLRQARIDAMVYSSPSWTAEKPKYRILAPTSGIYSASPDLLRELRSRLAARVNGVLGGIAANQETFTLSHSFYFGSVAGRPVQVEITEGQPVDLLHHLDTGAIGKPAGRPAEKKRAACPARLWRHPSEAPDGLSEVDLEDAPPELIKAARRCVLRHQGDGSQKYALANRLLDLRHRSTILSQDAIVDLLCWYDPTCSVDHAREKVEHAIRYRDGPQGIKPATIAEGIGR
jgi:hypothetical protein